MSFIRGGARDEVRDKNKEDPYLTDKQRNREVMVEESQTRESQQLNDAQREGQTNLTNELEGNGLEHMGFEIMGQGEEVINLKESLGQQQQHMGIEDGTTTQKMDGGSTYGDKADEIDSFGSHDIVEASFLAKLTKGKEKYEHILLTKKQKKKAKKKQKKQEQLAWKEFWIDLGDLEVFKNNNDRRGKMKEKKDIMAKEGLHEPNEARQKQNDGEEKEMGPGYMASSVEESEHTAQNEQDKDMVLYNGGRDTESRTIESEAREMWQIGRELGATTKGNDIELIQRMIAMEERDREQRKKGGSHNNRQ
ncbi:hypothetical protein RIF29_35234 [Crotalaria pallida]|uniref:Uncharacterized protein n=1 Tax=Crotalaria pallida TaxID=3830 RepID=A0AAN9ECB6_CROPI